MRKLASYEMAEGIGSCSPCEAPWGSMYVSEQQMASADAASSVCQAPAAGRGMGRLHPDSAMHEGEEQSRSGGGLGVSPQVRGVLGNALEEQSRSGSGGGSSISPHRSVGGSATSPRLQAVLADALSAAAADEEDQPSHSRTTRRSSGGAAVSPRARGVLGDALGTASSAADEEDERSQSRSRSGVGGTPGAAPGSDVSPRVRGRGVIENMHLTDVESSDRVCPIL